MDAIRSGRERRAGPPRRGSKRGLVLVASVGVLGVISIMGLAFATVMRLEAKAARNYTEAVRAEFVARAGIEDAIARLRLMAREGSEFAFKDGQPADWYTWRGTAGGALKISFPARKDSNFYDDDGDGLGIAKIDGDDPEGEGTDLCSFTDYLGESSFYTLKIEDAASKINVNVGDNLGVILDNLCRIIGPPLHAADQRAVVPAWWVNTLSGQRKKTYSDRGYYAADTVNQHDLFYRLGPDDRPLCDSESGGVGQGRALYGDGYAIAAYRSRHGQFLSLEDVRNALTWYERPFPEGDGDGDGDDPDGDGQLEPEADTPEEIMEVEAKFAALKPYITIDSWFDTDQVGYGKFEQIRINGSGWADRLTDRNACWNVARNKAPATASDVPAENDIGGEKFYGELRGCLVAIVNGVGQGQLKTIHSNTIDTIFLSDSQTQGSEMRVPPNHESCYVIIGKDGVTNPNWRQQLKLYARQPLSFHRAPVNINTASDKVLTALVMGLQTNWGEPGYFMKGLPNNQTGIIESGSLYWADAMWQCPSTVSVGRDECNAFLVFGSACPNDTTFTYADANQLLHGHENSREPFCFFCSFGHVWDTISDRSRQRLTNEGHYLAWQILKEREQTKTQDLSRGAVNANGFGSFRGWDDVFFRVFWPHEKCLTKQLNTPKRQWVASKYAATSAASSTSTTRAYSHPGIARLCMANFGSNTGLLKFQPNMEYIDRWGPNFTDLYLPRPDLMKGEWDPVTATGADLKLRVRPGELLDKSDLNIGTTEFCFDSGGVYDVESIGRVYDNAKTVRAERRFRALIKVYDVWRESTQREFVCGKLSRAAQADSSAPLLKRADLREGQQTGHAQQVGSVAVDQVKYDDDTGYVTETNNKQPERKALITLPEPLVPKTFETGNETVTAAMALGAGGALNYGPYVDSHKDPDTGAPITGPGVMPAGYDGQIMLATNSLLTSAYDAKNNSPPDAYDLYMFLSFTGDLAADYSRGHPLPVEQVDDKSVELGITRTYFPLDLVSLLGIVNDEGFDLTPQIIGGVCVEGEGRGGDLRSDGLYMGVVGQEMLDGSLEYQTANNFKYFCRDKYTEMPTDSWTTEGTYCMWMKPNWHHGTVMPASLPINYDPYAAGFKELGFPVKDRELQRGCHVLMRNYAEDNNSNSIGGTRGLSSYWDSPVNTKDSGAYSVSGIGYQAIGYVRDRFEHELFNAARVETTQGGNWSRYFRFNKAGDCFNSCTDLDSYIGCNATTGENYQGRNVGLQEFGALHMGFEFNDDYDDWDCRIPGMLSPRSGPGIANYRDGGRPYYQICPFRWFFIGSTWNFYACNGERDLTFPGDYKEGGHTNYGHPREHEVWHGNPDGTDKNYVTTRTGENNDEVPSENLGTVLLGRSFVDTMRTWNKEPSYVDDSPGYDLEDWAYEQYGCMYHCDRYPLMQPVVSAEWGINRCGGRRGLWTEENGGHMYQRQFSGTYATIDDIRIHGWKKAVDIQAHRWPKTSREWIGRYHLPVDHTRGILGQITGEQEPSFESQDLLASERSQNHTFELGEEDVQIEVCTVRWTAFTPFYCVDKATAPNIIGTTSDWRFPYNEYFKDPFGESRFKWTYRWWASPCQIKLATENAGVFKTNQFSAIFPDIRDYGVASRISSQRGCKVKVRARNASGAEVWFPGGIPDGATNGLFYEYPEGGYNSPFGCTEDGWQQVLVDPATGQHPKCKPDDLRYKVFFRLSLKEYQQMGGGSVLLDSPVFDDITITYMRRPKVLEWRDVSE